MLKNSRARWVLILLLSGSLLLLGWSKLAKIPASYSISADTDENGMAEIYLLKNNRVLVREGEQLLWQSPADWKVEQMLLADVDNDGQQELLLIL